MKSLVVPGQNIEKTYKIKGSLYLAGAMGFSSNRNSVFKNGLYLFSNRVIFRYSQLEQLSLGLAKGHTEMNLLIFRGH